RRSLYLAEGAIGLPFFAGGAHGWSLLSLSSASGRYLWGLVAVAFVVGFLARNGWDRTLRSSIGAMFLFEAVQYTVAIPWLAGLSVQKALVLGRLSVGAGDALELSRPPACSQPPGASCGDVRVDGEHAPGVTARRMSPMLPRHRAVAQHG
ncbi:MAG: biotin transporter BioY, partial [Actinomycetota bacterium]|nr:biotin transporter BioY [Actinomycetota bacterium]